MVAAHVGSGPPSNRGSGVGLSRSSSGTSQTARLATAPTRMVPALSVKAAQCAPRVAASNAEATAMRSLGSQCRTADRTVAQPASGVTGESVPNARCTPERSRVPNRFIACARLGPRRCSYSSPGLPQAASKAGCMLATTPSSARVAMSASEIISTCSRRCRAARMRRIPSVAAARRRPDTAAATASSPMQ